MALAPADFYAYSSATGSPYPETPEERARLAPQVLEFRRNQLKSTQQPPSEGANPLAMGIGIGLGLLGLGGAGFAARKMLRSGKATGQAGSKQADLSQINVSELKRASQGPIQQDIVAPSKLVTDLPPAQKSQVIEAVQETVDLNALADDAVNKFLIEYEQLAQAQARADQRVRAGLREREMQIRGAGERVLAELRQESLVEKQKANAALNIDQALNAVESGEDQMTGRMKQQLQRNENLDLSQIEVLEDIADQQRSWMMEQDEPINQVASQLPSGRPLDQAESLPSANQTSAARFMEAEREKIAREMAGRDQAAMPRDVDAELARRLGSQASTYGPKYSARRQALELFAKTGDPKTAESIKRFGLSPVIFETFENMPVEKKRLFETRPPMSLEGYPSEELIANIPLSGIEIDVPGAGRVDISTLRKPVITEDTALAAETYIQERKAKALNWLEGIKQEVEPQLNEIFNERRALIENQAAQLKPLLDQAELIGDKTKAQQIEAQLNSLRYQFRNPESHPHRRDESNVLNARINKATKKINEDMQTYERKYPTTLSDWSGESNRVFGELNVETGELIPETMELRAERPSVDIGQKGGGGRNIAEYTAGERLNEEIRAIQSGGRIRDYDIETGAPAQRWEGDKTQTGRTIGIYGISPSSEKPANPELRPSVPQYTKQEIENEAMRLAQADPYGDVPIPPEYQDVIESLGYQTPTPERRRSVLMSEQVRKGQLQFPQQSIGPYPSSLLSSKPTRLNVPQQQTAQPPVQLAFPSDVIPAAGRAGVRQTAADIAANQLETYMSRLQRGRSTPLTSAVRIQPKLF